jgi:DNA-binding beta-propeller fold protein YncE
MRRSWVGVLAVAAAVGTVIPAAAQQSGGADPPPSLEYRPKRPVLPEPKAPKPAPPVTIFREAVGGYGIGTGSFDAPGDVAIADDGGFFVLDTGNNRVQKFDGFANFVLSWGSSGTREGEFDKPQAIVVSPGGFVYVADTGNNRIQQFTAGGVFVKSWGRLGSRGGDFKGPLDLAFEGETSIWVADAGNDRLEVFAYDRRSEGDASAPAFTREIGGAFAPQGANFNDLVSVAWTSERFGYIYLLGAGCLVQQFQLDGTLVASWSAVAPESGLCVPERVRVDEKNDYVYVLDSGNGLLMRFTRDGRFLAGLPGAERTFLHPGGFAIDPGRDLVLVADTDNNIVQKFTLR